MIESCELKLEPRRVCFIEAAKRAWIGNRVINKKLTEGRDVESESEYKKPWFQSKCSFSTACCCCCSSSSGSEKESKVINLKRKSERESVTGEKLFYIVCFGMAYEGSCYGVHGVAYGSVGQTRIMGVNKIVVL